jgi:ankyrin repeat protein
MRCLWFCWLLASGVAVAASEAPLADAARRGDLAEIRRLIGQRANVNASQPDGTTALHWAAHQDNRDAAAALVAAGANANAANRYGVTPLALACTNGSGPMVALLLEAGADPNLAQPGGETALMTASRSGSVDAVRALLKKGAQIKAKESRRGQTALVWAAAEGNVEVVEALIEAGADFRERMSSGFTPFLFAVREGQLGVVKALLKAGVDVNESFPSLGSGRRPTPGKAAPRPGTTALHLAVINGHFDLAAYLLDRGANPNADGPGYTPLHVVTWIRKPGGGDNDPAPIGSGTMTTLEFVKKMAKSGANLDARMTRRVGVGMTSLNTLGATTFVLAARTGDAELMRTLAALGADPLLPTADGSTPLIVAAGLGTRSPGEDAGTEEEVVQAVQAAIDLGNDINAVDKNGETAMHGAAYKNLPAVVRLLAKRGANAAVWNQRNKQGWTPLTIAEGYRFGNYKPSPVTVAAFHEVMLAAGIPLQSEKPGTAGRNSNYVTVR